MPNRKGDAAISDAAVSTRIGKRWNEWFRILYGWGAEAKGHRATAKYLEVEKGVGGRARMQGA